MYSENAQWQIEQQRRLHINEGDYGDDYDAEIAEEDHHAIPNNELRYQALDPERRAEMIAAREDGLPPGA